MKQTLLSAYIYMQILEKTHGTDGLVRVVNCKLMFLAFLPQTLKYRFDTAPQMFLLLIVRDYQFILKNIFTKVIRLSILYWTSCVFFILSLL